MKKVLFLYTELAPYFLACVERLVKDHGMEVHIVRWPVNKEAPFAMHFPDGVRVHERRSFDDAALVRFAREMGPAMLFASGWVDKGYLKVCRALRRSGVPTVMCSDTAWRGTARQWVASIIARLWLQGTFSHSWVTGEAQRRYAGMLGFRADRIRTGFYSADVDRFAPLAKRFAAQKEAFPHRFLCVARYIPTKGHQLLCDAFAALCDEGSAKDWVLWIVGTGELHDQVRNSASGRHARIKHFGFVQVDAMPEVIAQCGVFVLPSSYEPWGVVVQEMACAGMPMLLSNAVGARERFLRENENGWTFGADEVRPLKIALQKMVAVPDQVLNQMGERSAHFGREWTPALWAATAMTFLDR